MGTGLEDRPLFSTRAEDPAAEEAIDAFVLGLAQRIDALQDAESEGALADVAAQLASLRAAADANGFDSLARRAGAGEEACRERDPMGARKHLIELTAIARRIRLGHKGAF